MDILKNGFYSSSYNLDGLEHRVKLPKYGNKYEVRGVIKSPSGISMEIVTAWIILRGEDYPRVITAYPGEKL